MDGVDADARQILELGKRGVSRDRGVRRWKIEEPKARCSAIERRKKKKEYLYLICIFLQSKVVETNLFSFSKK